MKRGFITLALILTILLATGVSAQGFFDSLKEGFRTIGEIITFIFGLEFLGVSDATKVSAFIRLCLWFFIFALFFEATNRFIFTGNKRISAVIAIAIAFIATFALTPETVLTIGGVFGFITAFLLIAIPLLPVFFAIFGFAANTRLQIIFKIVCILVAIWVLSLARPIFTGEVRAFIGQ